MLKGLSVWFWLGVYVIAVILLYFQVGNVGYFYA